MIYGIIELWLFESFLLVFNTYDLFLNSFLQIDGPKAGQVVLQDDEPDFYNQAYGAWKCDLDMPLFGCDDDRRKFVKCKRLCSIMYSRVKKVLYHSCYIYFYMI